MRAVSSTPPTTSDPNSPQRRHYAKIIEAAEYLGVREQTIRQMIAEGRLTGYRNGPRLIRVDLNEIDAAMKPYGGAV